jgi:hypothetical protein
LREFGHRFKVGPRHNLGAADQHATDVPAVDAAGRAQRATGTANVKLQQFHGSREVLDRTIEVN